MKVTVLNELHERKGARMVEFAGWRMPLSYTSILKEVVAVRTAAGLFDVTHMGRLKVSGADALAVLQHLTTNDLSRLDDFQGQYTLIGNERGGIVDDTIIYRRDKERFYVVVNASNTTKDIVWIKDHLTGRVDLEDLTDSTALLALQGPRSPDILSAVGLAQASHLKRFRFNCLDLKGISLVVARTGYTGEDGFEIACRRGDAEVLWNNLLDAGRDSGIACCGLGARDVLRIEAGYPLYGNELNEQISPVEAGLMRFVKMEKPEFIGKNEIASKLNNPPPRTLMGITMERRAVLRSGDIVAKDGKQIGVVTSGTWSPTLNKGIGMAYVLSTAASDGEMVEIVSGGKVDRGRITRLPFYSRG